ncbi:MAG: hypothetical protein JWQ11_2640 [Rhizobacter sp.]|nr:hypothetical protein [Rhizobacter sp.]
MNSTIDALPHSNFDHADDPLQEGFADFDDETLERALRTVSWNPRDVANYLRTTSAL